MQNIPIAFVDAILFEGKDGFSSVHVVEEAFDAMNGFDTKANPNLLPYTTFGDAAGKGGRKFIIHGKPVMSHREKVEGRPNTTFVMKTNDAKAHLSLVPWTPRINEKADFSFSDYTVKQ